MKHGGGGSGLGGWVRGVVEPSEISQRVNEKRIRGRKDPGWGIRVATM